MSRAAEEDEVRICPGCRAIVVVDAQMWDDPARCPKCGASLYEDYDNEAE